MVHVPAIFMLSYHYLDTYMACPPGKTRSPYTGYCRKPCARHQAINPDTGKCVTKNYLRRIQRESRGNCDRIYSLGSSRDYKDGLVADAACYPRKRNIYTGRCKTPCGPGRAINPKTGNCVTLRYLRMLNPEDYDTDGDDDMAARILFTPTDLCTKPGIIDAYDKDGLKSSKITDNDLIVMKSVLEVQQKFAGNNPTWLVYGVYNPAERKEACGSVLTDEGKSSCGLSNVYFNTAESVRDIIINIGGVTASDVFLFAARTEKTIPPDVLRAVKEAALKTNVRLLFAGYYGVWRILVPRVIGDTSGLDTSIQMVSARMKEANDSLSATDSRKLAHDIHEILKDRNNMHLSFAPYPSP